MSALDDIMKGSADAGGSEGDDEPAGSAEAAVKAFFDAGVAGDFKEAAKNLRDAITLVGGDDDSGPLPEEPADEPGHHALLLVPRGKH
jgi:hypothetical protein